MTKCTYCEVQRAKAVAVGMRLFFNNDEIAAKLKELFAAEYYTTTQGVFRANSVPPCMPYRILERPANG
jgi:hypothetical protein